MTKKENLLRAIKNQYPEWVPNGLEAVVTIRGPVAEYPRGKAGKDDFGVAWDISITQGRLYYCPQPFGALRQR
jgi:hypothetical protein